LCRVRRPRKGLLREENVAGGSPAGGAEAGNGWQVKVQRIGKPMPVSARSAVVNRRRAANVYRQSTSRARIWDSNVCV